LELERGLARLTRRNIQGHTMPHIQAKWRASRLTRFGYLDRQRKAQEEVRETETSSALRKLKELLSAAEYEQMATECQRGEREVRVENGIIMTCFSPSR
jgi:hypothetical protein